MHLPQESASVSRRSFMRMAGIIASVPALSESYFAHAALQSTQQPAKAAPKPMSQQQAMKQMMMSIPKDAVLINANENPLGPCEAARSAIASVACTGGRYDILEMMNLVDVFAKQNNVDPDYIAVYAGSSEPLHYSVLTYTGHGRNLVAGNPTYEAAGRAAEISGAKTIQTPLTSTYAHDVKALVAADPKAGIIYICNPNNPTGTITSKADIVWALENKPTGSILLVDEAYIHLSDAESVVDMVAADKDLIILRTFSKIYGMAGIRCGFALGRPDLLAKLVPFGQNAMPITGSAAANVSLLEADLVPTRKKIIATTRNDTFAWLKANNYKFIPSQSNCFMIDTGRNGQSVIAAMREKNVYIGRTWPIWPNVVRVSVGTPDDMAKFKVAFKAVMGAPAVAADHSPFEPVIFPELS